MYHDRNYLNTLYVCLTKAKIVLHLNVESFFFFFFFFFFFLQKKKKIIIVIKSINK